MPRTLSALRTAILNQADMADSDFINATQLNYWINAELAELHALLVESWEDYMVSTDDITLTGATSYSLPSDFFKALKVFLIRGNVRYRLRRFQMQDLSGDTTWNKGNEFLSYRIMGDNIHFDPTPNASGTVRLYYAPQLTELALDADTVSVAVPIAWEDFVVCGAAARCLAREESDSRFFLQRKEMLRQQFIAAAANRDAGEPARMIDHYQRFVEER